MLTKKYDALLYLLFTHNIIDFLRIIADVAVSLRTNKENTKTVFEQLVLNQQQHVQVEALQCFQHGQLLISYS